MMLAVSGLAVRLGGNVILQSIDLSVPPGTLVAVVGANGAGKTTLLRTISRLHPLEAGRIEFDGKDIGATPPHLLARTGLVHVPQGRMIVPTLSVEENLRLGAESVSGMSREECESLVEAEFRRFPILRDRRAIAGGSLSGGEQQMLAVSRALTMRPRLLMLDEPSLGLAPQIVALILSALRALADGGMTVLLVEQVAFTALKIADAGLVLQNGRVALTGPAAELLGNRQLVERYLG